MAKQKELKTNAMRLLDAAGIPYTPKEYEVDASDLSGLHIAEGIHFPPEQCFKTLVARGDKTGPAVFCIPVAETLNLKAAAAVSGNKKLEMVHVKDLLGLTGYMRGGCSPIGMKKKFPTYFDEACLLYEEITVSAGVRGCMLLLNARQLTDFVDAAVADLTLHP